MSRSGRKREDRSGVMRGAIGIGIGALVLSGPLHAVFLPLVVIGAYGMGALAMRRQGAMPALARPLPPPVPWTPPLPAATVRPQPTVPSSTPPPQQQHATWAPPPRKSLSPSAQIAAQLNALVARISKLVSSDVLNLVQSIVTSIEEILPMLDSPRFAVGESDAFTIRQTALHYLPDTIDAYFRLPPSYRTTHPLEDGKTARTLLVEQLTVLDLKMKEIAKNLATNDAHALVANGIFLRDRFATSYFTTV